MKINPNNMKIKNIENNNQTESETNKFQALSFITTQEEAVVMAVLEENFDKSPNAWFDKHCEFRADQANLIGSSMTEETGLTRHKVKKALGGICLHYKNQIEYLQTVDKFKNKPYCSYLSTNNKKRTRYFRNDEMVDREIAALERKHDELAAGTKETDLGASSSFQKKSQIDSYMN